MKINITQPTSSDFNGKTLAQENTGVDINDLRIPGQQAKGKIANARKSARKRQNECEGEIPEFTVGIDLGDKKHAICVLDRNGRIIAEYKIGNHAAAIWTLSQKYPEARFVMEVGTHSPWISARLLDDDREVYVANARKLRAIYANERKCDELDARMLSRIGRFDTKLLYPVRHVSQDALKDRLVISTRENLVNERKRLIQSVKGSVKSLGLRLPGCSPEVFPKTCRIQLADATDVLAILSPTLEVIASMNESIGKLDLQISILCVEKYPVAQRLMQIKGVGPITAIAFVLTIEDPDKIDIVRDVGAYLGLVPRRAQSGNTDKQLGISKTGNVYLRKLLVQCAQYIMGQHGEDCDLKRAGLRRASKGLRDEAHNQEARNRAAKGAKKKAVVAVARKLAVLLLTLWKSGADYEPFHNPKAKNAAGTC